MVLDELSDAELREAVLAELDRLNVPVPAKPGAAGPPATGVDLSERAARAGAERRAYPVQLEVRQGTTPGTSTVEGYASVTEQPYEMWDFLGSYTEIVRAGSFTKTLGENPQVQLLLNHRGLSMAYTKAGTLRLAEDSTGLAIEAQVNNRRSDVQDMLAAIEDGDVDEMSFKFRVPKGKSLWSPDYTQRDITEVDIHRGDVSVVNFGANDGTAGTLAVRAQDLDGLDDESARALYERLARRFDLRAAQTQRPELSLLLADLDLVELSA